MYDLVPWYHGNITKKKASVPGTMHGAELVGMPMHKKICIQSVGIPTKKKKKPNN